MQPRDSGQRGQGWGPGICILDISKDSGTGEPQTLFSKTLAEWLRA